MFERESGPSKPHGHPGGPSRARCAWNSVRSTPLPFPFTLEQLSGSPCMMSTHCLDNLCFPRIAEQARISSRAEGPGEGESGRDTAVQMTELARHCGLADATRLHR